MRAYIAYIEKLADEGAEGDERLHRSFMDQMRIFHHERLIHLIVTMTVALLTAVSLAGALLTSSLALAVLTILFIGLLIPYILHYYLLENGTERLYSSYDRLFDREFDRSFVNRGKQKKI